MGTKEVVFRHLQRPTANGFANVIDVRHDAVAGRDRGSYEIEFEHVGAEHLPRPSLLDGYVFGLLLFAMQGADRMVVEGRLSREAIRNAWSIGEAWNVWAPEQYRPVEIVADEVVDDDHLPNDETARVTHGSTAIAAFSGGADSMFTILRHTKKVLGNASYDLRDLCMVQGFDVPLNKDEEFENLQRRIAPFVNYVDCHLHVVRTNIRDVTQLNWEHCHGSQIAAVLHQFSDSHSHGLLASGDSSFRFPETKWGSSPVTDHYFSGAHFQLILDGSGASRFEKIQLLAKHQSAHDTVKVCYENERTDANCGSCVKCKRTRINFLAAGIDRPKSFDGPVTTEEIREVQINTPYQLHNYLAVLKHVRDYNIDDPRFEALENRINELSGSSSGENTEIETFISPSLEFHKRLREYKNALHQFLSMCPPVWTLTDMAGNIGDHLIWDGTEKLLKDLPVASQKISALELNGDLGMKRHGTLVIPGSGAFSRNFHEWLPPLVVKSVHQFDRVVILPSEYETHIDVVYRAMAFPNVYPFARDHVSYEQIRPFGRAALAMDPALYAFPFTPASNHRVSDNKLGKVLSALRSDASSLLKRQGICPTADNQDISLSSQDLVEFLSAVSAVDTVVTDRLHVVVSAAMLGKHVRYVDPENEKISRYVRFNFRNEFSERIQKRDETWLIERGFAVIP